MKITFLLICLLSVSFVYSQESSKSVKENHFGLAVNSSLFFELESITIAPIGFYYRNKHQFELGVDFHVSDYTPEKLFGAEFNYKYYVTGLNKNINSYFIGNLTYTNSYRYTPDISNYKRWENHISLNAGYGLEVKLLKKAFVGLNARIGVATFNVDVENALFIDDFEFKMFEEFYLDKIISINIGYRF